MTFVLQQFKLLFIKFMEVFNEFGNSSAISLAGFIKSFRFYYFSSSSDSSFPRPRFDLNSSTRIHSARIRP